MSALEGRRPLTNNSSSVQNVKIVHVTWCQEHVLKLIFCACAKWHLQATVQDEQHFYLQKESKFVFLWIYVPYVRFSFRLFGFYEANFTLNIHYPIFCEVLLCGQSPILFEQTCFFARNVNVCWTWLHNVGKDKEGLQITSNWTSCCHKSILQPAESFCGARTSQVTVVPAVYQDTSTVQISEFYAALQIKNWLLFQSFPECCQRVSCKYWAVSFTLIPYDFFRAKN